MHLSNYISKSTYSKLNLIYVDENDVRSKPTQFSYGIARFSDFCKARAEISNEWLGRKILALPKFCVIMPIKIIFHSAMAALFFLAGKSREAKAFTYYLIRDFEEALGHLIVIFNDNLGSYLLQESKYQKECYDLSLFQSDTKDVVDQWLEDVEETELERERMIPNLLSRQGISADFEEWENKREARMDELRKKIKELEETPDKNRGHLAMLRMYRKQLELNENAPLVERQIRGK